MLNNPWRGFKDQSDFLLITEDTLGVFFKPNQINNLSISFSPKDLSHTNSQTAFVMQPSHVNKRRYHDRKWFVGELFVTSKL